MLICSFETKRPFLVQDNQKSLLWYWQNLNIQSYIYEEENSNSNIEMNVKRINLGTDNLPNWEENELEKMEHEMEADNW